VVAYVREQTMAGRRPAIELVSAALSRLGRSESRPHAIYGNRQLALLERLAG
jgi:hypothetical protein